MIKLGVVGYGRRMSNVIEECLREVEPEVRVGGVVDPDEAGARSRLADVDKKDVVFCKDMDELVRRTKPDALAIGTRCNLHAPYAIEAAKYDLPLYLEKPVATSMDQAVALERAFENSKCTVVVSFPLKVSPLCRLAREYIDRNTVGTPEHVMASNYVTYGTCYWQKGYRNYEITQGLFLQKATHDVDYISHLMGSPIVRVGAMATCGRIFGGSEPAGMTCAKCPKSDTCLESPENRKRNGSGGRLEDHFCVFGADVGTPETGMNEDSSSMVMEFASGAHGVYTQVFYSRRDAAARGAVISGYQGTVSFDWYKNELKYVRHHQPFTDTVKAGEGLSHFGGDTELAHDFINLIRGKGQSRTPIEAGIQSAYICLAAKESAETGCFVAVRQVGQSAG